MKNIVVIKLYEFKEERGRRKIGSILEIERNVWRNDGVLVDTDWPGWTRVTGNNR